MAESQKVQLEITAEANKALDEIKRMVGGLQGLASTAGIVGAAYLGGRAILNSFAETLNRVTEEASRQEQAEMGLAIALRNAGIGAIGTIKHLTDYAETLQRLTGIDSSLIIETEKSLSTFGLSAEAIKKATRATLDFAIAQGVDLHTAAMLIGKAYVGQTETLARYGIRIDENLDKNKKFDAVIFQLQERFGGFAEMMGSTFAGSQRKASAAIADVAKEFGFLIIQNPAVKGGFDAVTDSAYRMADAMKRAREEGTGLVGTVYELLTGLPIPKAGSGIFESLTSIPKYEETISKIKKLEDTQINLKSEANNLKIALEDTWSPELEIKMEKIKNQFLSNEKAIIALKKEATDLFEKVKPAEVLGFKVSKPPEEQPKSLTQEVNIDIKAAEAELQKLEEELMTPAEKEVHIFIKRMDLFAGLPKPEDRYKGEQLAGEALAKSKQLLAQQGFAETARLIKETINLEKDAAQEKIKGITSATDASTIEKANRLAILRDMHEEEIIQWKEYNDAIENLIAGRSEYELNLEQAQLEVRKGILSETGAAILAQNDVDQAVWAARNEFMIAGQKDLEMAIIESFANASVQGIDRFSASLSRAIVYGGNLADVMKNVGKEIITMMLQVMIKWAVMHAVGLALGKTTTATVIAQSVALAASWLPAATLASIATYGGATAVGNAAMTATIAAMPAMQAVVSGLAMAGAGSASAEKGAFTGGAEGLIFVHPREIIAPETKILELVNIALKSERGGRGIAFGEGSITINVYNPIGEEIDIDKISDKIGRSLSEVI